MNKLITIILLSTIKKINTMMPLFLILLDKEYHNNKLKGVADRHFNN